MRLGDEGEWVREEDDGDTGEPGAQERLDGACPPWGAYPAAYSSYDLGQFNQTGSGLLGGWSLVTSGGYFELESRTRAEAEAWEECRRRRIRPAWAQRAAIPTRSGSMGRAPARPFLRLAEPGKEPGVRSSDPDEPTRQASA